MVNIKALNSFNDRVKNPKFQTNWWHQKAARINAWYKSFEPSSASIHILLQIIDMGHDFTTQRFQTGREDGTTFHFNHDHQQLTETFIWYKN